MRCTTRWSCSIPRATASGSIASRCCGRPTRTWGPWKAASCPARVGVRSAPRVGAVGVRVCLEVQYPATWEDLATQRVPLILFPSEQAGGSALSARAWQTRTYVLSAVSKGGPSALIDPVGHVAARWLPETPSPVLDVSLDYAVVHLDPAEDRIRRLAPGLKGRVTFRRYDDERVCLVTSHDPRIAVSELLSEQGIPTLDEYLEQVHGQNRSALAEGAAVARLVAAAGCRALWRRRTPGPVSTCGRPKRQRRRADPR